MSDIKRDLTLLVPVVCDKALCLQSVAKECGINLVPFETLRTSERQQSLYDIGRKTQLGRAPVTWTLKSKHLLGEAIDWVFDLTWWKGDWQKMWRIAEHCGFVPVKNSNGKIVEWCHTEHDGQTIPQVMERNQWKYNETSDPKLQYVLHLVNSTFRKMGYK